MAIKNDYFSLSLKYDDEDALPAGANILKKLLITYNDRMIPQVTIQLRRADKNEIYFKDHLDIELSVKGNEIKIQGTIAIIETNISQGTINGLFVDPKHVIEPRTKFLGSNLKDAVNSLGYSHSINGVESIEGEYFQWNETDNEILLDLLNGVKKDTFVCITEDTISVVDKPNEYKDLIVPSIVINEITNQYDSKLGDKLNITYLNDMDTALGSTLLYDSLGIGISTNNDYTTNYMYNLRYRRPPKFTCDVKYNKELLKFKVGDGVKIKLKDIDRKCVVTGKILEISSTDINTILRLGEI